MPIKGYEEPQFYTISENENGETVYTKISVSEVNDITQDELNYKAWQVLEDIFEQIDCMALEPSEKTAKKIAEMRDEK